MVDSIVKITLDLQQASSPVSVSVKRGDIGRKIIIALSDGGFPYDITEDCYAVLTATKPDGNILYNRCIIDGNTVIYEVTEQTTSAAGRMQAEVKLYGEGDRLITSASFRIVVHEPVCSDEQVESTYEASALTQLVTDAREIVSQGEEIIETAQTASDTAVQAASEAVAVADAAEERINEAVNRANTAAERAERYPEAADEAKQTAEEALQNVNTLREVVSNFHSNIQETASGEVITVSDASDLPLAGLKVFGKTIQDGPPIPEAPVPLESVGDGGAVNVLVNGKNLFGGDEFTFVQKKDVTLKALLLPGTYTVSAEITTTDTDSEKIVFAFHLSESNTWTYCEFLKKGTREYYVKTITEPVDIVRMSASVNNDFAEGDTATWRNVQVELGSVPTGYEPYRETQALAVTTPNGLPGIPVESGGNYTDPVTKQQWICDYVDFSTGKYMRNVWKYTLTGTEAFGSTASNFTLYSERMGFLGKPNSLVLSTDMPALERMNANKMLLLSKSLFAFDSVDAFMTYLKERHTAGNPVEVLYILENTNPEDLREEAMAAYAALHTNYPNTTVFNDKDAGMEVKYVADTKLYIDKKFAELATALVNRT